MPEIKIRWPRGQEYALEYVPPQRGRERPRPQPSRTILESHGGGWQLVCKGKAPRLEVTAAAVYKSLAECRTKEHAKAFAEKFGLPRRGNGQWVDAFLKDAETVRILLAQVEAAKKADDWETVRRILSAGGSGDRFRTKFEYVLTVDGAGWPIPFFEPADLFSFAVAQLIGDYTGGRKYLRCANPNCAREPFFYVGPGSPGHRRERQKGKPAYCSPACRLAHAYQKSKEKRK